MGIAATPFERFKDLTRKLIKVPKEELDAKLAEEKTRKVVDQTAAPQVTPQGG